MGNGKIIRGEQGEQIVYSYLNKDPVKHFIINNLTLEDPHQMTHQIDHILIRPNGVFIIETKNYYGEIIAKEQEPIWQRKYIKEKQIVCDKFKNPILQNKVHLRCVKEILPKNIPVYGFVIFVKNNIDHLNIFSVCNLTTIFSRINLSFSEKILSDEEMDLIYKTLLYKEAYSNQEEHIKNIKNLKKEKKDKNKELQTAIEKKICPKCGNKLVLETNKLVCSKCNFKIEF